MWQIFSFECRYQLRSPLFLAVAAVFFLLGFLATASESVQVGGVGDNLNLNAADAIVRIQYTLSVIGMFAAVAFVAGAITRDFELRTAEIFFATGMGERDYLFGRFLGGWLFATLAIGAGLIGTLTGTLMPWLDPERIGPFEAAPYAYSVFAVVVPNAFVVCALFFSVAALTRSMMAAYVAALGFMVVGVVLMAATDPEQLEWLVLTDPFGTSAYELVTRYWTVYDRNFRIPEFSGSLLLNRLIWGGAALLVLVLTASRFRFAPGRTSRSSRLRWPRRPAPGAAPTSSSTWPVLTPADGWRVQAARLWSQLRMDVRGVVRSVPFYVLLAFGMFNVLGGFFGAISQAFGTPVLPVTGMMIRVMEGSFMFVVLIIIIYYSGELVHRERQHRVADIVDAAPHPSGITVLAKVGALWFVISALLLVVMATSMAVQAFNGYFEFEPGLYLVSLFGVIGFWFYLLAILAVLVQVVAPGKFAGMLGFLLLVLGLQTLPSLGFEHNLYLFSGPNAPYSAMNGYGHFVEPLLNFSAYWLCFSVLLLIAAHLLFPRGAVGGWRDRLATARSRFVPGLRAATGAVTVVFALLGAWIYYNTNVVNEYRTEDDLERTRADYEKNYKAFARLPLPDVSDLDLHIELYPAQRRLESRGSALLENTREVPIDELHFSLAPHLTVNAIDLPGATRVAADERLGYYRYRLDEPLAPGTSRTLSWDLTWANAGFVNGGSSTRLVGNGTFVDNSEVMPLPGYDYGRELTDNNVRRDYELGPVERLPKLGDPSWLDVSQFLVSGRSDFRATVGTAADQIAVAPGYLQREWTEGDRRYFEYAMDAPIWPFVSFSSARYAVARDRWNDVALEVYYHPAHRYNVDAMLHASRRSLDYFTMEFSPYQYRQFRILEFPGYQSFAQSFPNTIPYSEAIGFIADLRDPENIDYVFYVTAHELAHQWWGHQVAGANMQGATLIVETLAQYSALMVQEREFGPHKMRRFLKYELDNYLRSRGGELIEELPLVKVESQGYVHYRKGSLAMYALKDYLGEAAVNRALRGFLERYAFAPPPFPTSLDLIAAFRAEATPEQQQMITDLFEKIVLFDLKTTAVSAQPVADGFEVTLTVEARKVEADGAGQETEVPLDYLLDVGIFPAAGADATGTDLPEPLLLEKHRIVSGENVLTFTVPDRPAQAGIDPYVKMIDRNPDDNLLRL
ncbi:MAG: M1 family aminopeptidase [Pseudomonadales bacterium]